MTLEFNHKHKKKSIFVKIVIQEMLFLFRFSKNNSISSSLVGTIN